MALGLVAPRMWGLSSPGTEPLTLALASGIFTPGPPAKSPPLSHGLFFCFLGTWWALAFLLFVLECFFQSLIGWASLQLNILAQVRVIFTRHTDTFSYNFQQRPGLGRGFQRLFASILLPPGKEIFPVSKVTCFVCLFLLFFFFFRNSFEQKHLFVPVGWWPFSAIRGASVPWRSLSFWELKISGTETWSAPWGSKARWLRKQMPGATRLTSRFLILPLTAETLARHPLCTSVSTL